MKLINFTELDEQSLLEILSWRNDERVRVWMYNQKVITKDEHFAFVESLKSRDDKRYFLVVDGEQKLGVIDFYNITLYSCEFGIYANPNAKIAGIGRTMDKIAIEYAKKLGIKTLKLEVYSKNIAVLNLHKKFGFVKTNTKTINELEVTCLEMAL